MKSKMIVKLNTLVSYETAQQVKKHLLNQWNNGEIVLTDPNVEIQAIILEDVKGEITVINLKDGSTKKRKNILKKIKKLFKKKNKA